MAKNYQELAVVDYHEEHHRVLLIPDTTPRVSDKRGAHRSLLEYHNSIVRVL